MARKKGSRVSKDGQGNGSTITSGKFNSGNQIQGEAGNDGGEVFGEQVEVLRYWFLLDRDMVDAIEKGNSSLVPVALAQANYLKKVIKPQLLEEGLKGEEEALWSIHRFLHNNGWWERARNLVIAKEPEEVNATDPVYDFLKGNNHFVDPNTMGRALKGERECIRRALNQIHYGSLRLLRFNGGLTPGKLSNEDINFKNKDQSNIIKDFLNSYSHLIEPSVLHEALKNDEKALALALGQIHHKTLPSQPPKGRDEMTFKDALLSPTKFGMKTSPFEGSRSPSPKGQILSKTVFFTGFDNLTHARDLWKLFKQETKVIDIILPRKRDRYGNRVGFLKTMNSEEAIKVVKKLNGYSFGKGHLYLALAKDQPKKVQFANKAKEGKVRSEEPRHHSPESCKNSDLPVGGESVKETKSGIELKVNEDIASELKCCMCLVTAKHETVDTVEKIVEGLGFRDATIKGISSKKFLAYFDDIRDLSELDTDFLSIGFMEVREVTNADLIPSRKVWIELRGLPILGWTEENYNDLVKEWGDIIHFGKTMDSESFYTVPKVMIETQVLETIDVIRTITLAGHTYLIRLMETLEHDVQPNYVEGEAMEEEKMFFQDTTMSLNEEDQNTDGKMMMGENACKNNGSEAGSDRVSEIHNAVESAEAVADKVDDVHIIEESEDESLINPATPRGELDSPVLPHFETVLQSHETVVSPSVLEEPELELATKNWRPRETESLVSQLRSKSDNEFSEVDNYSVEDYESRDIHPSILQDLNNLKVQRKRGRPRKQNSKLLNKHFKVPRKKKGRGEGLQLISHFFLNEGHDEAEAIYETGVLMGLIPLNSKENSISLIRERLQ